MAAITGLLHGGNGVLSMAGAVGTEGFKNWVLTWTVDDLNTNSLDDALSSSFLFEQRVTGLQDWEATADQFDMSSSSGTVLDIVGIAGQFIFTEGDGGGTNKNVYTANGIIDSVSKVVAVDDIITCSIHVVGNGAIAIT